MQVIVLKKKDTDRITRFTTFSNIIIE